MTIDEYVERRRATNVFESEIDRALFPLDLNSLMFDLLHVLGRQYQIEGDGLRSGEIAQRLGITSGGATRAVARAQLRGLVQTGGVEGDARGVKVTLTPAGTGLYLRARRIVEDLVTPL